jgi:cytochrome c biogenesis protein CcmG, thiol:disulfide interchange protein DsbE
MKRSFIIWMPLALAFGFLILFYAGLRNPTDHVIASKIVGKPIPEFQTIAAIPEKLGTASADYKDGKPRLLNVFASWCIPCVAEIPVLQRLKIQGVEINGVAVHDATPDIQKFLAENGDPYSRIGLDEGGNTQVNFGSAGVPETFVIDGKGKVLHQHIGVITEEDMPKIIAMLEKAR